MLRGDISTKCGHQKRTRRQKWLPILDNIRNFLLDHDHRSAQFLPAVARSALNLPVTPSRAYADVFGAEGLAEYRRLAESEWAKIRPPNPSDKEDVRSTRRFRITRMMEALARQSDDTDSLVEIKRRDLSDAYSFLKIAEIYREAGQHDKALDWAEQGIKSFSASRFATG
jgi:hypothetical protein